MQAMDFYRAQILSASLGGVCFSRETSVLLLCVAYLKAERETSFWNAKWHSVEKCPTREHEKGKLGLVEKKSM